VTRDEIAQAVHDTAGSDWGTEAHFQKFAAVLEGQMIRDGWRQCAVGQKAAQFCGQLEAAVEARREEIEQLRAERNTAQANLASIRMAREAGGSESDPSDLLTVKHLERFAALVAAAQREECAKVCEEGGLLWGQKYAAAIRARGET
jgi:ribosomal protein L29